VDPRELLPPPVSLQVWISSSSTVFPAALKSFLVEPDKIVFISLKKDKDVMWAMNEALRCESLTAVIGELNDLDFKSSRRLQLAVEQSMVTGFILRSDVSIARSGSSKQNPTACVSRWAITPLPCGPVRTGHPSCQADDLPGLGYPRWNVELMKIRNGRPGTWQLVWANGQFQLARPDNPVGRAGHSSSGIEDQQRKAG